MAAGLWRGGPAARLPGIPLAIRSRHRGVTHVEDKSADLLDLIPLFHDRALADGVDWDRDVAARIARFTASEVNVGQTYRLYLEAHGAVAFIAGWLLHRADVVPVQNSGGQLVAWPGIRVRASAPAVARARLGHGRRS